MTSHRRTMKAVIKQLMPAVALAGTRWLRRAIDQRLPDAVVAIRVHRRIHGELPRVIRPRTFSEKVLHRKLFDRRPLLTRLADKYAVRDYVQAYLGQTVLTRLYCVTEDPSRIAFDELPTAFVVKPTHGSGWVRIVPDKAACDLTELVQTCRSWLRESFYERTREWPYKNIRPRILVEELIDDGLGGAPVDYKLFVFAGRADIVQVDVGRFDNHRRDLYTRAWERLEVEYDFPNIGRAMPAPPHLAEMIHAAETLARGLDFVRADFYDTPRGIVFGELTTTPDAGLGRFVPRQFDLELGARWVLPELAALRR